MIRQGILRMALVAFAAAFCLSPHSAMAGKATDAPSNTQMTADNGCSTCGQSCTSCPKKTCEPCKTCKKPCQPCKTCKKPCQPCKTCPKKTCEPCKKCPEKKKCEACPCPKSCDQKCPTCPSSCGGCSASRKGAAKTVTEGY